MKKEEIKEKYFSCIYCLTPLIIYDPSKDTNNLITKCFKNHEIKYNINDFISFRKEQFKNLENIICDKCQSKKNLSFCNEEKCILCQKCFPKNHKDKNHTVQNLNKIDKCPKHNKDYFYCDECKIIYCKNCGEDHAKHKFYLIKDYFLSENEIIKMQYIINKLETLNQDLNFKIFNSKLKNFNYSELIYNCRHSEISLYMILKEEYLRRFNKSNSFNILFNIRNLILNKFIDIKNISYIDFINQTKTKEEDINNKNLIIKYLTENYINFDNTSYNKEDNISILKDDNNKNLNIKHFLLLKNNNIFIACNVTCFLYDKFMNLKGELKLKDLDEKNIDDKYEIISYIHYKKNNNENINKNIEIIYAFITSTIYEITITKINDSDYTIEKKEFNCKRISYKIDGVIDMPNGDIITCSHMYPVICWRKDNIGHFYEYKILTEQKPYIKNAVNIIHLPNNEFTFTSHSWPSIKFYKYESNNDIYNLIKDIKLNCSSRKNTLVLYKNKILIVGLEYDEICFLNVLNKEIIFKMKGINIKYIFVKNNGEIIIKENYQNFEYGPKINIYTIESEELLFKGVLKNKLQIYIEQIYENKDNQLFISGYEHDFKNVENNINKIYIYNN